MSEPKLSSSISTPTPMSPKKPAPLSDAEKKARRSRNRERAVRELLSTEKTYVRLLTNLVKHFVTELRSNTSMLSSEDYRFLFPGDIIVILGLNQTFLEDLTGVIEGDWNNENTKIGHILQTFCPHFKMYQNYCNIYNKAATRLAKLRKKSNSAFSKYCDKQNEQKYFNNLPLESLIILPIQRIPRYNILLKEIIKNTESDHPDLEQLQQALSKISEVSDTINAKMKEWDSRIKVQNIENRFNGKLTNLVTPSRRFITEGKFCKVTEQDDQMFLFILFSDCILYASRSGRGDKLVFGNFLPFTSQFKIEQTPNHINRDRIKNLFELHSTKESFMLYASSRQEMVDFMEKSKQTHAHHMSIYEDKRESTSNVIQAKKKKVVYARTLLIPNDFAERCMMRQCDTKFGLFTRRHHCLYCGYVVCNKCSLNELQSRPTHVKHRNASPEMVRVCDACYAKCVPNKALSVLGDGALSMDQHETNTSGLTKKMVQLLGVNPKEFRQMSVGSKEDVMRQRGMSMEEDLLKKYDQRAAQFEDIDEEVEEEEADEEEEDKEQAQGGRRTAVLNFVKYDVEPQLLKLETVNIDLQQDVNDLKERVLRLERENHRLSKELEEKEEIIQSLVKKDDGFTKQKQNNNYEPNKVEQPLAPPASTVLIDVNVKDIDVDSEDEKERICATCHKEIVGRALKTNGGLHHRECFACGECGVSLAGQHYGVVFEEDGGKFKVCAECTNVTGSPRSPKARLSIENNTTHDPVNDID
eukprot:622996_1